MILPSVERILGFVDMQQSHTESIWEIPDRNVCRIVGPFARSLFSRCSETLSLKRILLLLTLAVEISAQAFAQNPGVPWPATDALGRSLPTNSQVGPPRADRTVAMFYFLWHETGYSGPFDVSKILAADPGARHKPTSPPWGPLHAPHHWGESIFGYYLGDDEAVLRKHAQMLADAGVDVIVFDTSNKATYPHNYLKLFEVFRRVRKEGNRTPQVAFLTPFGDPRSTVNELYKQIYAKRLYEELWFRWDGKPLILADPAQVDQAPRGFFTFRKPQPDYFRGPTGPNMWSWLEIFPQHVFKNSRGQKEEMSVGAAQNAIGHRVGSMSEPGARGRSFHGNNYAEQWERALKEDPRLVFITGWNEWIAGRFDEFNGIKTPPMFVDEFDEEHSRDIEPMKGGHGDNYYWQTVNFIRPYKGVPPLPPAVTPQAIVIDGKFDDWKRVQPEYQDTVGDPVHRHHRGWGKAGPYVNNTGRNDIVSAKVSCDAKHVYFYVRTKNPLTPSTDPNWMLLLIDSDANPRTGWLGYDLVIRPGVTANSPFKVSANEMELALPRSLVHNTFDFKWCDNIVPYGDASRFTLDGDAAPNDRFNYRAPLVSSAAMNPVGAAVQREKR